jgi:DNA sulfur modification protein DndD
MKLKSARIQNFKLLRDLRLDFSADPTRPLTVVRAENGSGKTSTLMALRWVLYGQDGLDDKTMRLSPTTWRDGETCTISVQLDFSHTLYNLIAGETLPTVTDYRLLREVTETPDGAKPNRTPDKVSLFEVTDAGVEKIDPPERRIAEILPPEMQNIFFTDGDAALTFISPQLSRNSRRDQVQEAIRSLLGLGLLESTARHLAAAKKRFNTEVANASASEELAEITEKLTNAETKLAEDTDRLRDVERQISDLVVRYADADNRLQQALQAGNFDDLAREKGEAEDQANAAKETETHLKRRHQQLLQDERVSLVLAGAKLESGFGHLVKLHDAGVIPSGSIPVLQERLDLKRCICGTDLSPGTDARDTVEALIAYQRTVDESRKILTELHHAAKVDLQRKSTAADEWLSELADLERTRLTNQKALQAAQERARLCEERIAKIDKTAIEESRKTRDSIQAAKTAKEDEQRELEIRVDRANTTIAELTPRRNHLLGQEKKLERFNSRLTVTEDMIAVVDGVLDDLNRQYLERVSDRMNTLFLEMVGADPVTMIDADRTNGGYHSSIFTSAGLTTQYEIVVKSANNKTLNPDHELNGASKRALTFSFIWALTEVSQIIAPRIIDTPLGMMSGQVKKRVIELITTPAGDSHDVEKQVVLFLTRDEIRGIEDVIDSRASSIMTFTNTDQLVDLVNKDRDVTEIVRCECNHRQHCDVCARVNDGAYGLVERPIVGGTS